MQINNKRRTSKHSIKQNKIDTIYDYKLDLIHKENLPSNSIIITHIDPGKKRIITKSHDQIFYNHYIVIDENEISKRLKTLKNIIKSNKKTIQRRIPKFRCNRNFCSW